VLVTKALICTFNPSEYLYHQVKSIIDCGINSILIYDDSYSMNKVIDEVCHHFKDSADIKVFEGARKGNASSNFIKAICDISEDDIDWLYIADQDDVWNVEKVIEYSKEINSTKQHNQPVALCSDAKLIDTNGNTISHSLQVYQNRSKSILSNNNILFQNCVQGATLCINKSMMLLLRNTVQHVDIDNIENLYMYDWLIAVLAVYHGECRYIDKPLISYRIHDSNLVGARHKIARYISYFTSPMLTINKFKMILRRFYFIDGLLGNVLDKIKIRKLNLSCKARLLIIFLFK
jgi:hypothetical protein